MLRKRLMIICEDVAEVEDIRQVLERMGFDPEVALDPAVALEVMVERQMSAVVLDLDSPKKKPYEWVRKLHAAHRNLPIVGLSSKSKKEVTARIKRYGGRDVLKKPIEPQEVVKTMEKVLRPPKKRTRRSASR